MTEPTDLIERLRTHFDDCPPRIGDTSATRPLLAEAADEITALRDRVTVLTAAVERARRYAQNIGITDGGYIAQLDAALSAAIAEDIGGGCG